jgi:membrane-bound lytic murein transglycosylase A
MRFAVLSALLLALASCTMPHEKAPHMTMSPVSFADLDGWQHDAPAAALTAFQRSCAVLVSKPKSSDWKDACAAADRTELTNDAARAYFEEWFIPYEVKGGDNEYGLFTGYYMPELNGSLQRGGAYQTPLYERPSDMISVDLGAFKANMKGQRIAGKIR